jgi:hypothetical protein
MIIYSQKYYTKYNQIVKHYKELDLKKSKDLYTESHHVIPKSMGGTNKKENLVRVPGRVHFLLHWMLYRIYRTKEMAFAWASMRMNRHNVRYTSRSFVYASRTYSESRVGHKHSAESKAKMSEARKGKSSWSKGKSFSDEHKAKIAEKNTGKTHTLETRQRLSAANKGKKLSVETKNKISASRKKTK